MVVFSFGYFVVMCSQIFAPTVQKLVLKGTGIHWRPIILFCLFLLYAWEWEKLFPREIPLNRIWIWLIHVHMYLCLKFFVSLFQCFERDCFVQKKKENQRAYISLQSGVDMQNSVLVLSFFQMFLTLKFQYCLYLLFFMGYLCLILKLFLEKGYKAMQ